MSKKQKNTTYSQSTEPTPQIQFTEEELIRVDTYAGQINLSDSTAIIDYGTDLQKKLSQLSERMLSNLNSQDMTSIGEILHTTIGYLKDLESDETKYSFWRKPRKRSLKEKYKEIEENVDKVTHTLQQRQIQLMKDCALLSQMYEMNTIYYQELNIKIAAGKRKIEECKQVTLPQLDKHARQSKLPQDAQAVADLRNQLDRLEKKVHELELTASISLQSAPLIRMIQSNQASMASKIQSTLLNTIPLWKNQVVFALGMEQSKQNAAEEQNTNQMINQLLQENAQAVKQASAESAQALKDNMQEVESLDASNKKLIANLTEVAGFTNEELNKDYAIELQFG